MADVRMERAGGSVGIGWRRWLQAGRTLSAREVELVGTALVQVFVAHLLFGANRNDLALGLAAVQAALLLRALTAPWARQALRVRGLRILGVLFGITLALILVSLIPLDPPRRLAAFPWLASPTGSINADATILALVKLAGLGCAFVQGLMIGASRARATLFMKVFVVLAAVYATVAILGFWAAPESLYGAPRAYHGDRLAGSFLSANSAGAVFGMALLAAIGLMSLKGRGGGFQLSRRNLAIGASAVLLGVALLLTGSRGALGASAAAIVLLALSRQAMARPTGRRVSHLLAIAGVAIVVGAAILLSPMGERLTAAPDDVNVRVAIVTAHWPAIRAELPQGYGAGSFDRINAMIQTPETVDRLWSVRALHNVYLQWLEEGGLATALPMWGALAVVLGGMASNVVSRRPARWPAVILAISVMLLLHGLIDYGLEVPSISGQWALMLGLGYASAVPRRRRPSARRRAGAQPIASNRGMAVRVGAATGLAAVTLVSAGGILIDALTQSAAPVPPVAASIRPDVAALRAEARRAPADAEAWLRAAIAEQAVTNRCGPACIADLEHSYRAAPLSRPIFAWRTRFVLEHWDQIPVSLRETALRHVTVTWRTSRGRREVEGLSTAVVNPAGRLAVSLTRDALASRPQQGAGR